MRLCAWWALLLPLTLVLACSASNGEGDEPGLQNQLNSCPELAAQDGFLAFDQTGAVFLQWGGAPDSLRGTAQLIGTDSALPDGISIRSVPVEVSCSTNNVQFKLNPRNSSSQNWQGSLVNKNSLSVSIPNSRTGKIENIEFTLSNVDEFNSTISTLKLISGLESATQSECTVFGSGTGASVVVEGVNATATCERIIREWSGSSGPGPYAPYWSYSGSTASRKVICTLLGSTGLIYTVLDTGEAASDICGFLIRGGAREIS